MTFGKRLINKSYRIELMTKIIASATAENKEGTYRTDVRAGNFAMLADEPLQYGGTDLGPSPADYLCMSLASCQAITLRMYLQRKQWKADVINVKVNLVKADQTSSGHNTFYVEVTLQGDLTDEQQKRLLEIAKACPVHKLLSKPNDVVTVFV